MIRQQGAEQQRAKFGTQAQQLESESASKGQQCTEQHQQFSMSAEFQQPVNHGSKKRQGKQPQGPDRGRVITDYAQQRYGDDVLDDEDTNGNAPVKRAQLSLSFQHLGGNHGA